MRFAPIAMHIPDGFLSIQVAILFWVISVLVIGYALKQASKDLGERQVPMMGVLAAAIFAGQMLNFAVAGGTSGHLIGAALATILLGPWAAMITLTCIISIQALIFQDGGLLVLGANIFNMAILGVMVSYMVYRLVIKIAAGRPWGNFAGGFASAWLSVEAAALVTALELSFSGTSPANIAIPAMGGIHALIGVGEGLITLGALAFIRLGRSDLIGKGEAGTDHGNLVWVIGLLMALIIAVASPLASRHPDGLMWVASRYGFIQNAQSPLIKLIPHYNFPGVQDKTLATIAAALVGTVIVFLVASAAAYARRHRHQPDQDQKVDPS